MSGLIDQILSTITIDDVFGMLPTLKLKKQGRGWAGECPAGHSHKGSTSFSVSSTEPVFNCFSCGLKGNYIHLVELATFGECSQGKGWTDTFDKAVALCCDRLGIEKQRQKTLREAGQEHVYEIIELCMAYYATDLDAEALHFLEDKYGFSEDFVRSAGIGYGATDPYNVLSDLYTDAQILSTGLFFKKDGHAPRHIYGGRIVFPFYAQGRIKYSTGRSCDRTPTWDSKPAPKYFKQLVRTDNHPYVSELIQNTLASYRGDTDYLVITEGTPDFLALKMHGVSALSPTSVTFKEQDEQRIIDACKKYERVYICNDTDENGAGLKGAERLGDMLLAAGIDAHIVRLPVTAPLTKMDTAEFLKMFGLAPFTELLDKSPTYIDYLLERIPMIPDRARLMKQLAAVCEKMTALPRVAREGYITETISPRYRVKGTSLTSLRKMAAAGEATDAPSKKEEVFSFTENSLKIISSGQDYLDGKLYYTVTQPGAFQDEEGVFRVHNKIYVVTSDRKIIPVKDGQVINENLAFKRKLSGDFKSDRWSLTGTEFSVENFVGKKASTTPDVVYQKCFDQFTKFVYFKNPDSAALQALVAMFSYFFMCDEVTFYQHYWAEKRSGKTTCLEVMSELGFNAMMSSSISDAALFRVIETYRPLLLMDEAEGLNPSQKQREGSSSEKLELLKSGYKKTGKAMRCEGQNNVPVEFSNFCPKIFASIKAIDSTLDDRTFVTEFQRADEAVKIAELRRDETKESFQLLRDELHVFGLTYYREYLEFRRDLKNHDELLKEHRVTFRNREIWGGILSLAQAVDKYNGRLRLFDRMLRLAKLTIETKDHFNTDNKPMMLIEMFYTWAKNSLQGFPVDDIYYSSVITEQFVDEVKKGEHKEEFYWLSYAKFKGYLRKHHVIDKDSDLYVPTKEGKRARAIRIPRTALLNALRTYKTELGDDVLMDLQDAEEALKTEKTLEEVMD